MKTAADPARSRAPKCRLYLDLNNISPKNNYLEGGRGPSVSSSRFKVPQLPKCLIKPRPKPQTHSILDPETVCRIKVGRVLLVYCTQKTAIFGLAARVRAQRIRRFVYAFVIGCDYL